MVFEELPHTDVDRHIWANRTNRLILERLPKLDIPDAWLVSGAVFQTIWNGITQRPPDHGILDYDIFYYDATDLSWEAEDRVIAAARSAFSDLPGEIQIRNQARVHLWYESKFGRPYPPLRSATDGLTRFLAIACMIAVQRLPSGQLQIHAPLGYDDVLSMTVRPNKCANFSRTRYAEKAQRWKHRWPELTVLNA